MSQSVRISTKADNLLIDHVSALIVEASQLHDYAMELAAAGHRPVASELRDRAVLLASNAISFRYDLADAHADTADADNLIATLDQWAVALG